MLKSLRADLRKLATPEKKKASEWFFKTAQGQYGFGDKFIGVTVPEQRTIAKKYQELPLIDLIILLKSEIHEERLTALIILVHKFQKADQKLKKDIYEIYLKHSKYINNWDLVDTSAPKIVGEYLQDKERSILYKLAKSKSLWERRIAIISTFQFIYYKDSKDAYKIAEILLADEQTLSREARNKNDLIHKAVGWMLREAGKRVSKKELMEFLKKHYKKMPRTMLRYAIEKMPQSTKLKFLKGTI